MDKLKPCPFCGSNKVQFILENDRDLGRCWYVGCRICYARGTSYSETCGDRQEGEKAYGQIMKTLEHAEKAWNRRAGEAE